MNGDEPVRKYGKHKYDDRGGTNDCDYGCGCWMGRNNSGGPAGIDPFGLCPNNPIGVARLPGNQDYEHLVKQRINGFTSEVHALSEELRLHKPSKVELAAKLKKLERENDELWHYILNAGRSRDQLIDRYWTKRRNGRSRKRKQPKKN